jgi:hypothetical protein
MSEIGGNLFVVTATDAAQPILPLPFAADLVKVYVNLATPSASAVSTVTVKKNGTAVTPAGATVAINATKANVGIVNPYIGVNAANQSGWTDQQAATVPYTASAGGVNNVAPLASFAAGDTLQVVTALGATAAGAGITLVFEQR